MRLSHVLITNKSVYFDGIFEVPCYIADSGVQFTPGPDVNRLTVEFLTGPVHFDNCQSAPTPIYDHLVNEIGAPVA